jgi:low affinity Fe/Cu permease
MEIIVIVWSILLVFVQGPAFWPWIQEGFALECIYLLGFIPKSYFIYKLRPGSLKNYSGRRSAVIVHWTALAIWIVIGTILIWTGFNRSYIGKIFAADAVLTFVLTLTVVIQLDHKHFVANRDAMSLPEQYETYVRDLGIDVNNFIRIYKAIASSLGYDVHYLRPTDKFCDDYLDDLDVLDLFEGICRQLKIARIKNNDMISNLGGVESIGDFVRAFESRMKSSL